MDLNYKRFLVMAKIGFEWENIAKLASYSQLTFAASLGDNLAQEGVRLCM